MFAGPMLSIVSEHEARAARNLAPIAQDAKVDIESQAAKRHHHLNVFQQIQFALQIWAASPNLFHRRLVVRRSAADGCADVGVDKLQPVVPGNAGGLGGKTGGEQYFVEKIAGAVAGEDASRAIGAVGSRRQSDQKQPGFRVAEAWHWLRPIIPIAIRAPFDAPHLAAIFHQARALLAPDDLALQNFERLQIKSLAMATPHHQSLEASRSLKKPSHIRRPQAWAPTPHGLPIT